MVIETQSSAWTITSTMRWGAISGLTSMGVLFVAASFEPSAPQPGDTALAIQQYYSVNGGAVLVNTFGQSLAAVFLLGFVAAIAALVRRVEGDGGLAAATTLAAGVVVLALTVVGFGTIGTLGFSESARSDPVLAKTIFDLGNMVLNAGDLMIVPMVLVPSLFAIRHDVFARWLGWIGVALAGGWAVASVAIFATSGPMAGPHGPYGLVVVLGLFAWIVGVSISILRRSRSLVS